MECNTKIDDNSYDFFENIHDYITKEENSKSTEEENNGVSGCDSFSALWESYLKNKATARSICVQFKKLYKSLSCYREDIRNVATKMNDCKFLNYWVNWKLNINKEIENICVKKFYQDVVNHCVDIFSNISTFNLEHNINNDDLNKMTKLYNLYKIYGKINSKLSTLKKEEYESTLSLSDECYNEYNIANSMCNGETSKFCEKLKMFKSDYEDLYNMVNQKDPEFSNRFKRLREQDNNNIISTALLGSVVGLISILGGLYKFTSIGQYLKFKKAKLCKVQCNKDEEIRKIPLRVYDNEQISLQQGIYNIKYYSVENL